MSQSYWQADCLPIVKAAQNSAEKWARVATFVILTIRQMFFLMPAQMQDVLSNGRDAVALFGFKQNGYDFIVANKESMWSRAIECKQGAITLDDLILSYLAIPGLGIVKSSFLAQLTVGEGACIDAHNLQSPRARRNGLQNSEALDCRKSPQADRSIPRNMVRRRNK